MAALFVAGPLGHVAPAHASTYENWGWMYRSSDDCTWWDTGATPNVDSYGDYDMASATTAYGPYFTPWFTYPCNSKTSRLAGQLLVQWAVTDGDNGPTCLNTGWQTNNYQGATFTLDWVGPANIYCGSNTTPYWYMGSNNYQYHGGWHGGGIYPETWWNAGYSTAA